MSLRWTKDVKQKSGIKCKCDISTHQRSRRVLEHLRSRPCSPPWMSAESHRSACGRAAPSCSPAPPPAGSQQKGRGLWGRRGSGALALRSSLGAHTGWWSWPEVDRHREDGGSRTEREKIRHEPSKQLWHSKKKMSYVVTWRSHHNSNSLVSWAQRGVVKQQQHRYQAKMPKMLNYPL